MALTISMTKPEDRRRFKSYHWVHTKTADNKELITVTGIVLTDFKGAEDGKWRREKVKLGIRLPSIIPYGKALQIEHWAPFVTINAIWNKSHAINAGWAVDEFGGPGRKQTKGYIEIWAKLAVRDTDGWLYRIGFSLTLSGELVDYEEPIIE